MIRKMSMVGELVSAYQRQHRDYNRHRLEEDLIDERDRRADIREVGSQIAMTPASSLDDILAKIELVHREYVDRLKSEDDRVFVDILRSAITDLGRLNKTKTGI